MRVVRFTLALGLFLATANGAFAQNGSHKTDSEKAANLMARADQIQDLDAWGLKARLYEQAAGLLSDDDKQLPSALLMAGSTYFYIGQKTTGTRLLARAATVADRQGNTNTALDAYYLTLVLAAQNKQVTEARRIIDRMVVLAASEDCNEAQRLQTLRRISAPLNALSRHTAN
jgi:hypothetical protein